jgi:hypothetical protein
MTVAATEATSEAEEGWVTRTSQTGRKNAIVPDYSAPAAHTQARATTGKQKLF